MQCTSKLEGNIFAVFSQSHSLYPSLWLSLSGKLGFNMKFWQNDEDEEEGNEEMEEEEEEEEEEKEEEKEEEEEEEEEEVAEEKELVE